ncbi:MAG: AAA family ATPase [Limnothrix sp. RL_2_0]|nr:AAA family ATPase [Limnothrix sp. RL_2_0]
MALCFPSLKDIENFRVPLEPGERHLLDFLLSYLDDCYEIYVQPFLNGDRPDIIIVRPNSGVLIIEVKDWNLEYYRNPSSGNSSWKLAKNNADIRSPLAQVESYKENFYNLHIDKLFERNIKNSKYFAVVQTAVYFHKETTQNSRNFCGNSNRTHIFGHDALSDISFKKILALAYLISPSTLFDKDLYQSFKRFLKPPEHTPDMGKEIRYEGSQKELIKSRAGARQKIRGVAGCGKTKVLAKRAVNSYVRTKEIVLVLTFNITLRNYIHDQISEVREYFPWSNFEITNYHQFFKTQANNYGLKLQNVRSDPNQFDHKDFFSSVKDRLYRYQTILVDEVQDYKNEWLRLLVEYFLAENGEFVVFGDEKQNIYDRRMGNDMFPVVPTVIGSWNKMNKSFRMETFTFKVAQAFQEKYFQGKCEIDKNIEIEQLNILEKPAIFQYDTDKLGDNQMVFERIYDDIRRLEIHPNDVVVLSPTYDSIRDMEYCFRHNAHEQTSHMGETQEEYNFLLEEFNLKSVEFPEKNSKFKSKLTKIRRGRKLHFWQHYGTVKLSSIYSFKGWEAHTLFLIISNTHRIEKEELRNKLIYTALTRARKNLIVFDENRLYEEFFREFIEK